MEAPVSQGFQANTAIDRRYRVRRLIARGGMASVLEAEHIHTGRRVALKVLNEELRWDASARSRLIREARALELCRSAHVTNVLDAGFEQGQPYLALEMLDGRDLGGLLAARGRLPLAAAVGVLVELCAALEVVHQANIVHRDIKPSNLFLTRHTPARDRLKLLDFGIARLAGTDAPEKLTQTGERLGTFEYMAPEQFLNGPLDHRTDLFSAAAVFFECVRGDIPFATALTHRPLPSLSKEIPGVPPALDEVVTRALAGDREARFASAGELAAAVRAAAGVAPSLCLLDPAPAATSGQGRSFQRAPYATPCRTVLADGRVHDGRTADISEGGLLAIFPSAPAEGAPVRLRFCLPLSGRALTVDVLPRWHRSARHQAAVGLEFDQLPDEARIEIQHFVRLMGN